MSRVLLVATILLILVAGEVPAADTSQRTQIVVGSELDYPPYALVTEDGQADGFSVDLMKAVSEVVGIDVTFRVGPWSEVRAALENGEIDALPLVSYSEEREKVFDFTVPHTMGNGVFLKRKGSPNIESTGELGGKEIVVMRSDATHDWLLRNGISDNLVLTETVPKALRALAAGKHDYALVPHLVGLLVVNELGLTNLETTGSLINIHGRGYGFAVTEGNSVLLAQFNEGLNIIKATGRYDEIYEKWFGIVDPRGIATAVIVRYVIWGAGGIAALIGLALTWIVVLRRTVTLKTAEVRHARDDLELRVEERTRDLQKEITERKQAEEELRENEEKYRNLVETSHDLIWSVDAEGRFTFVNRSAAKSILGYEPEEMIGRQLTEFKTPEQAEKDMMAFSEIKAGQKFFGYETVYLNKDGSPVPMNFNAIVVKDEDGNVVGTTGTAHDITERKRAEEKIKASLAEKEVLLREIHHRVKNNLQVISSMLWMQAKTEKNTRTVEVLRGSYRRVMLMAKIHESLHRFDDLNVINIRDFLNTLVTDTKVSSGDVSEHLSFHIDVDDISLDVDHANAYGQIISELLSNSLKYAFTDGQPGNIEISLHQLDDGVTELSVADDGKGLPEDFDLQQTKTLGLQLVSALAAKLGGTIHIDGSGGTLVRINFPEEWP